MLFANISLLVELRYFSSDSIPKECIHFGIKMCHVGHTYDMNICLEKDRMLNHRYDSNVYICKTFDKNVAGYIHKLCMKTFFSFSALFSDLTTKKVCCCEAVNPNRNGILCSSAC